MTTDELKALAQRQAEQLPMLHTREAKHRQVALMLGTLVAMLKGGKRG